MPQTLNLNPDAPWKARFRAGSLVWTQIASQNPKRGIALANTTGSYQLHAWDVEAGDLTPVTAAPGDVVQGAISADGQHIYYLHSETGDGIGHYMRVPFKGGTPEDLTPTLPPYASFHFTECATGRYYGFIAANQNGYQVFVVDAAAGGTPHLRYENPALSAGPLLSYDGEISVVATTEPTGTVERFALEAYDTKTGQKLGMLWDGGPTTMQPVGFATRADDLRFVALTNATGRLRPVIWEAHTGRRRDIPLDTLANDVEVWDWSTDGRYLLLKHTEAAVDALYLYDLDDDTLNKLSEYDGAFGAVPGYFSPNGNILAHWENASTPPRLVVIDRGSGAMIQTMLTASKVQQTAFKWQAVAFQREDGPSVPAWQIAPAGLPPYPSILHLHGGPTDVKRADYDPVAAAWSDHGFAYCSLNYHGSTSFGLAYQIATTGQPGRLEIDDIVAAARGMIAQGIAQPDAIFLSGSGYGATLALLALARYPNLWAGALVTAPVTDWAAIWESVESLRDYGVRLFGGTPAEKRDTYQAASPLYHVDAVRAPLHITLLQDDPHLPEKQVTDYVAALQAHGKQQGTDFDLHTLSLAQGRTAAGRITVQVQQMAFVYRILGLLSDDVS